MDKLTKKTRRKLSNLQSGLVCQIYEEYDGKWEEIMLDERIKRLNRSREYLSTHIANRKKYRKRQLVAKLKRGDRLELLSDDDDDDDNESEEEEPPKIVKKRILNQREPKETRNTRILNVLKSWIEEDDSSEDLKEQFQQLKSRQMILENKVDQLQSSLSEVLLLLNK